MKHLKIAAVVLAAAGLAGFSAQAGNGKKAELKAWDAKIKSINRANRGRVREVCRAVPHEPVPNNTVIFTISFEFDVPVETLFDLFTDMEKAAPMYYPVKTYRVADSPAGPTPFGVGSVRAFSPVPLLKYQERIEVWDKPSRLEWAVISGAPVKNQHGVMIFEALDEGRSRMTETVQFEIFPPLAPLARALVLRENVKAFLRGQALIHENPEYYREAPELLRAGLGPAP